MTTPVEKRNASKFCEFHGEVGHTTDECMHLKRQIEEMLKAGKLSHLIKELKQSNGKDQAKVAKKGGNLKKGQNAGNTDGTTMAEGSQTKDYSNFLSRVGSARREARGKENQCSSIHNTRNAKIPSDRQNGHITEQQDHSTRVHHGFKTRDATARSTLTEEGRKELCGLLRRNLDIFAWKPADMTGVPRHIADHRLNIREGCLPVRQKKRGWLSNPVMVKKHDNSWRMCVDFKDLNKACPKDGYPYRKLTGR
ncbi:hypothetical protein Tco_0359946 [Tanacetum coccineum]